MLIDVFIESAEPPRMSRSNDIGHNRNRTDRCERHRSDDNRYRGCRAASVRSKTVGGRYRIRHRRARRPVRTWFAHCGRSATGSSRLVNDTLHNLLESDLHAYYRRDGTRRSQSVRREILLIRGMTRSRGRRVCRVTGTASGRGRRRRCLARCPHCGNPGRSRLVSHCEDRHLHGSHHMTPAA